MIKFLSILGSSRFGCRDAFFALCLRGSFGLFCFGRKRMEPKGGFLGEDRWLRGPSDPKILSSHHSITMIREKTCSTVAYARFGSFLLCGGLKFQLVPCWESTTFLRSFCDGISGEVESQTHRLCACSQSISHLWPCGGCRLFRRTEPDIFKRGRWAKLAHCLDQLRFWCILKPRCWSERQPIRWNQDLESEWHLQVVGSI